MDQQGYLSRTLWKYRSNSEYTDLTLVCGNGSLTAHAAMLAGLFVKFGISFPSKEEVPECLFLPDITTKEVEHALKVLYSTNNVISLFELVNPKKVFVKEECKDIDRKSDCYPSDNEDTPSDNDNVLPADLSIEQSYESTSLSGESQPKGISLEPFNNVSYKEEDTGEEKDQKLFTKEDDQESNYSEKAHPKKRMKTKLEKSARKNKQKVFGNGKGLIVNGLNKFKCAYCRKRVTKGALNVHLAIKHREQTILNHPEICFSKPCGDCDMMFLGFFDLDRHSMDTHGKSIKEWKCKKCDEMFATSNLRNLHRRKDHRSDIPTFKCPYCKYRTEKPALNNHIYTTHKDKRQLHPEIEARYNCEQCDETFYSKSYKDMHMKTNHITNSVCPECSKVCVNMRALELHMIEHSGEIFVCEICSKEFKLKSYLKRHVNRVHNGIKDKEDCLFPCKLCTSGRFATEEPLQRHMLDCHSGVEYFCSKCPKSFANQNLRRIHEQNIHGEKTEKCEECDMMFATVTKMGHHVRQVHRKVKDKICPHCGEAFFVTSSFHAHVNRHTNTRPWKCETCGKDFLLERHLKSHMDRHTLPYECDQCDVKRGTLSDLKLHKRSAHGGEQLTCRHGCGYQTWGTGNRGRHERDCKLNPIPGAPYSVSNGSATQYILDNYHLKFGTKKL